MRKFLILIGWLSPCCGARYEYHFGWDYKEDGHRCRTCKVHR